MNAGHCPRCGAALDTAPPATCLSCTYQVFVNSRPCAGAVVLDGPNFLAVTRVKEPFAGVWDVPGGFCEAGEHPADTAVREVFEETGLHVVLDRFIGIYMDDYPYQGEILPILNCYWTATVHSGQLRAQEVEVSAIGWLPLIDHPPLAFAHVERMMRDAAALIAGSSSVPASPWRPGWD